MLQQCSQKSWPLPEHQLPKVSRGSIVWHSHWRNRLSQCPHYLHHPLRQLRTKNSSKGYHFLKINSQLLNWSLSLNRYFESIGRIHVCNIHGSTGPQWSIKQVLRHKGLPIRICSDILTTIKNINSFSSMHLSSF